MKCGHYVKEECKKIEWKCIRLTVNGPKNGKIRNGSIDFKTYKN